ncbi:MAG: DUF1353 domain-containing protein [Alphaproteobacteria bacterium]|nr:DUF1353 domain-containing protein [Alphaproteobacteria bacterium]
MRKVISTLLAAIAMAGAPAVRADAQVVRRLPEATVRKVTPPIVEPKLTIETLEPATALQSFRSAYEPAFVEFVREARTKRDARAIATFERLGARHCPGKSGDRMAACLASHIGAPQVAAMNAVESGPYRFNTVFTRDAGAPVLVIFKGDQRIAATPYANLFDVHVRIAGYGFGRDWRVAWFDAYTDIDGAERTALVNKALEDMNGGAVDLLRESEDISLQSRVALRRAEISAIASYRKLLAKWFDDVERRDRGAYRRIIGAVQAAERAAIDRGGPIEILGFEPGTDESADLPQPPSPPTCALDDLGCLETLVVVPQLLERLDIDLTFSTYDGAPNSLYGRMKDVDGEILVWAAPFEENFRHIVRVDDRGELLRVEDRIGDAYVEMFERMIPFRLLADNTLDFNGVMQLAFREEERPNFVIGRDLLSCVNDELFLIPAGFITDFMSVSQGVRIIFPEGETTPEREWAAALLHDWLYAISDRENKSHQNYAQARFVADLKLAEMPPARRAAFAWATGSGFSLPAVGRPGELRFATRDSCARGVAFKGNPRNALVGRTSCDGLMADLPRYLDLLDRFATDAEVTDDDILANPDSMSFFEKVVANADNEVSCDMIE